MNENQKIIKSSFNRGGLSVLALYGIFQAVGSIGLGLGMVPLVFSVLKDYMHVDINILLERFKSGGLMTEIAENPLIAVTLLLYAIGSGAGLFLGMLVMRLILQRKKFAPVEKKPIEKKTFFTYLAISFGVWSVGVLIGNLPAFCGLSLNNPLDQILDTVGVKYWPMLLYAVVGAPIFEELTLRKTLLDRLHHAGEFPAAVVSGILFGLIHANSGQFFLAFFLGVLWAVMYQKTGKVIYSILCHMAINFFGSIREILGMFGVSGTSVEVVWYVIFGILGAFGLVILFLNRKKDLLKAGMPSEDRANRQIFGNVGMRLAMILGFITIAFTDVMLLISALMTNTGARALIYLVPTALCGAALLVSAKTVCRKSYIAARAENTEVNME